PPILWGLALRFVSAGRALARTLARRLPSYQQRAIIVGAGDIGQLVARKLRQHPEYNIDLVGVVDEEPKPFRRDLDDVALLGPLARLPTIVRLRGIGRVISGFSRGRP